MARRNAILGAVLLLQLVWLGTRVFQAPPPAASAARGLLLTELVPAEVVRLEIESGSDSERRVVLEREGKETAWSVPALFDYPADANKVDEALRLLAGLEIARVVSSTAHHHVDFKVAESEFEKRIRLEALGEPVELLVGSTGPAGTIHLRQADEDAVYAVRGYSSWRFPERAEDWIDKVYFSAPQDRIAHVAVSVVNDEVKETTSFSLERVGAGGWSLSGPGDARSPADGDKVDSLLRAMSRVSLSELVGRIGGEDITFGDPVAEIRLGLAALPTALETASGTDLLDEVSVELADEPDAGEQGEADTSPVEIEETLTLRVALAPGESGRYWLHAEGSEFVVEVARWTVRELLEAVAETFQAPEEEETPEIVEVDDTEDSDETYQTKATDNYRGDDPAGAESEQTKTQQD